MSSLYIVAFLSLILLSVFFIWYSTEFFKTFIYEPRETFFFSRKGVITPSYTLILYENIQDVHLEQTIFDRIFGLWEVKIYTATHSHRGSEHIFGLSYESANKLKTEIFSKIKDVKKNVN
ncbi:MAG: PH domain-containing protein [Candidatus Altiarchaeota archaeon]